MLCLRDYADRLVSGFSHKIKPEYCGGNRYVSIEGIELEHLSTWPYSGIKSSTKSCSRHAVFHYFLSDDIKQDDSTAPSHIRHLIELLK